MKTTEPKRKVKLVPFSKAYELVDDWIKTFGDQYDNDFENKDEAVLHMVSMYAGDYWNSGETVYVFGTILRDEGKGEESVLFILDGMDKAVFMCKYPLYLSLSSPADTSRLMSLRASVSSCRLTAVQGTGFMRNQCSDEKKEEGQTFSLLVNVK